LEKIIIDVVQGIGKRPATGLRMNDDNGGGTRRKIMTTKRISSLTGKPISIEEELDVTKTESIECLVVALKNPVCKGSLF